jgi:F0F1-type ATP synthase membrane subunit c/vacuolar-type H+-ATPase subunit K
MLAAMATLDPAQARRTNWALWAALLVAQVVYVGIAASGVAGRSRTSPPADVFSIALGVVGIGTAIGAHLCWRHSRGASRAAHEPPPSPQQAFTFFLLACVLDESIAIYGLVLALLGAPVETWAPFSAAAFALLLLHRPA